MKIKAFLIAVFFALTGWLPPAMGAERIVPQEWQSPHFVDHGLVGKIFDGEGKPASEETLRTAINSSTFTLIGEIHTNPDHHRIQTAIVQMIGAVEKNTALVWEMVPQSLGEKLEATDLSSDPGLRNLGEQLQWKKRGWGAWEAYRPIAVAAVASGMTMRAGNPDRGTTRLVSRRGPGALPVEQQKRFALNLPLPAPLEQSLIEELEHSHCGMLPKSALPAMVLVQRVRDGVIAATMKDAINSGSARAILIAGNGHVRRDRGVPFVLRQQSKASIVSIGLIEVVNDEPTPDAYGLTNEMGNPLYDFVVFTPKSSLEDPCERMRAHMKKKKTADPAGD